MTAVALSLLIDNSSDYSNITCTAPISYLLREDFILSDEWNTTHITVEDALSHWTGYPRHDLVVRGLTRDSVRNLRNLPMSAEPRARYQYCKKMYGAVGYLIETLTGCDGSGLPFADEYYYYNTMGGYVSIMLMAPSKQFGIMAFQSIGSPATQLVAYKALHDHFVMPEA
ncbi:hypothetical protein DL764_008891 [Monosporascus ibericus]|uniref:Uncharacterized protein n=1 Tax=Monosporascus ibericus TaxID=155417 RepID=A0A4Q4SWD1_9PEZI|nr:hypothetical protein DL764_008891 [Monosporascus ibericus]